MTKDELLTKLNGVLDSIQCEVDNYGQIIIYTDGIIDENAFDEILELAEIGDADNDEQILIYTRLTESADGQLINFV